MIGYRSGSPCEFCDAIAAEMCLRCQAQVCERHQSPPDEAPHCRICAKEARDDADVARFRGAVLAEEHVSAFGHRSSVSLFEVVAAWLGRLVFRSPAPHDTEADVPFEARTPDQIRAWRRSAGVRTRG